MSNAASTGAKRKSRFDAPPPDLRPSDPLDSIILLPPPSTSKNTELPNTLDTCQVGIMASVLKESKNLLKKTGQPFVPYTPLGGDVVPAKSVIVESMNEIEVNRINDFYDELDDLMNEFKNEIQQDDPKFNYSKRKQYNVNKQLKLPIKIISEEELVQNKSRLRREEDGSAMDMAFEPSKYSGLGTTSGDAFESFRRNRASKYHEYMAIRGAVIKDPSCIVITSKDLCYSCNQPGHYAKDCKYGIR